MSEQTELRDSLAVERTRLANERTLLAYLRTGIAFALAGASAIHFLGGTATLVTGWVLVALAVVVSVIGLWRFATVRRQLNPASGLGEPGSRERR